MDADPQLHSANAHEFSARFPMRGIAATGPGYKRLEPLSRHIVNLNFILIYSLLLHFCVYIFCSLVVSGFQEMLHNKPHLPSQAGVRASSIVVHCEVLRGAFEDLDGHMRHGKVGLPSGNKAGSADPAPVLLATEDGAVLDILGTEFPALAILGVGTSPLHPVAATVYPAPRYDSLEIETFRRLLCLLKRAISDAEASLLGQVATASARVHQRRLPKPQFDGLLNVAVSFGACGLAVDHGGSGAALIFDPKMTSFQWRMQGAARALRELGISLAARRFSA